MKDAKINYSEGDIVSVPLRDDSGRNGYGVIARMDRKGKIFGYFFQPDADLSKLEPEKAILVGKFGDLGLIENSWSVVKKIENWDREKWTMPPLMRIDDEAGLIFLSYYDDVTMKFVKEVKYDLNENSELKMYPQDNMMGAGSVELKITKLVNSTR
ncbi:MAG: Imm26 family immunity protein [Candidatus Paceibacterota bacterium]